MQLRPTIWPAAIGRALLARRVQPPMLSLRPVSWIFVLLCSFAELVGRTDSEAQTQSGRRGPKSLRGIGYRRLKGFLPRNGCVVARNHVRGRAVGAPHRKLESAQPFQRRLVSNDSGKHQPTTFWAIVRQRPFSVLEHGPNHLQSVCHPCMRLEPSRS
jgi:hypothetical protein